MFEPLHDSLVFLKAEKFRIETEKVDNKPVLDYLESAPVAWESVVKKTFKKKEEIMPLKDAKVEIIKEEIDAFFLNVRSFRNDFRKNAPFAFAGTPEEAYTIIDDYMTTCQNIEAEVVTTNATQ